ncbi:MAG: methyltransferase [Omnitrophica WOR_2 bacterium RIFCSPHIGHO2_02_FULL_45_21]|nr:MAG: methyltransferase [Omnitrophica WOR_2 bacterium RIFCSPHIGHO2_02_FULL_45_21]
MRCRVCDSEKLELAIDLGYQPWCNNFLRKEELGKEPFYPLRVVYCLRCSTAQLDYTVPKEVMFTQHTYLSGVTKSLNDHFRRVAEEADMFFFSNLKNKSVLDIGSNDGTQLKHYQKLGYEVMGVESSKDIAEIANAAGIYTVNEFFNLDFARRLGKKFNLINAAGVFFHLEELHSVAEGIRDALDENGIFLAQFLYMKSIIDNCAFDQIYHEHLLYYNLKTINFLLNLHGLCMFDAYLAPIHGGSVIGFITHSQRRQPTTRRLETMLEKEQKEKSSELSTYLDFAQRISRMKEENIIYLDAAKQREKRIFGFGAPAKGNTLLNYFKIGARYIDYLVEKNELRRGLYSPGMHIPIVIEKELREIPDIYYVLAWNYKDEILSNNQQLTNKGVEFYFPINPKEITV